MYKIIFLILISGMIIFTKGQDGSISGNVILSDGSPAVLANVILKEQQ